MRRWIVIAGGIAGIAALVLALGRAQRPLEGPQPVAWDREACAHCRMLVSEKGFAAQIVEERRALHFDDPGCLFDYLGSAEPSGAWFHHLTEERWIPGDAVGFVPVEHSPMGFRIGAVDAGAPGAMSREEAARRVLAREQASR
jgi:copper chaperone NosL